MMAALRDLIDALDRRAPRRERDTERRIASESDALRQEALARLEAISELQAVAR